MSHSKFGVVGPFRARALAMALLLLSGAFAAHGRGFSADVGDYTWDLQDQYPSDAAWERERARVVRGLQKLKPLQGRVGTNPAELADALDVVADARGRAGRMARFGILSSAVDTQSELARSRAGVGIALEAEVDAAIAFVAEEMRGVGEAQLREWLETEPRLRRHRFAIEQALYEHGHARTGTAAAMLKSLDRVPQLTGDAYLTLIEGDPGWPLLTTATGDSITLSWAEFSRLRRSMDRAERERAASLFFAKLTALAPTFAVLLNGRVEASLASARYRGFDDPIDAEFYLRDGLPAGSYKTMYAVARDNLATLRQYEALRARALGIRDARFGDRWVAAPAVTAKYRVDRALELALAVAAPLGPQYQSELRRRLAKPHMHLAPSPRKRQGYGVYWQAGGGDPYTVMSYEGDYRSARTLAASAMLAMSYASIPPEFTPATRLDPPVYSNAIIYASDALHADYVLEHSDDRQEKIALLLSQLDRLRRHAFDYALLAEFDERVFKAIAAGKPLTATELSDSYFDLLRAYHGPGFLPTSDSAYGTYWIVDSAVEFFSYEHLFWPPAMGGGLLIADEIARGTPLGRRAVTGVLGRVSRDYSYELLRSLGIDVATRRPYEAVIVEMKRLMDTLEPLVAEQGR